MNIDDIKGLLSKYAANFEGSEDFEKIKANGEDLLKTLGSIGNASGGLGNLATAALGKLGLGNSDGLVEKALSFLGGFAKSDNAKNDFLKLQDAIKKFIG